MSHYEIIVYSAAFIAVAGAIIAFVRTPDEQKFGLPKHIKMEGVEYAPEYSPKEKRRQLFWALLWVLPFFAVANYVWLPWFNQYVKRAHCDDYGSFTGFHIIAYSLFVGAPIIIALVIFAFMGPGFVKVFQVGQFPLPGKKVSRPTKYVYGWRARLMGTLFFIFVMSIAGIGIWGYFAANEHISSFESKLPVCPKTVNKTFKYVPGLRPSTGPKKAAPFWAA